MGDATLLEYKNYISRKKSRRQSISFPHSGGSGFIPGKYTSVVRRRNSHVVQTGKINALSQQTRIQLAPTTADRVWSSSAIINGFMYTSGGGSPATDSVEKYNFQRDLWTTSPEKMNHKRCFHNLVAWEEKLYALGGLDHRGRDLGSVECFDVSSNEGWKLVSPMRNKRWRFAAVTFKKMIYVIGGTHGGNDHSSVERYDPISDTWCELASHLNKPRWEHSAQVVDGKIHVFGGSSRDVEVYDEENDEWQIQVT